MFLQFRHASSPHLFHGPPHHVAYNISQPPTHPDPCLFSKFSPPFKTQDIHTYQPFSALDEFCETGQSQSGTSAEGSGATLVTSASSSSQVQ